MIFSMLCGPFLLSHVLLSHSKHNDFFCMKSDEHIIDVYLDDGGKSIKIKKIKLLHVL